MESPRFEGPSLGTRLGAFEIVDLLGVVGPPPFAPARPCANYGEVSP